MHSWNNVRCLVLFVGSLVLSTSSRAAVISWNNPAGGDFTSGADWLGGIAPGSADQALFDLSSAGFTVTFADDVSVLQCKFDDEGGFEVGEGPVWFEMENQNLTVLDTLTVGSGAGNLARVSITNGDTSTHNLVVGQLQGSGYLTVLDRIDVSGSTFVGSNNGGAVWLSSLIVQGAAGQLRELNPGETYIGQGGASVGALEIKDDAYAEFEGNFYIGTTGGVGILHVSNGGTLVNLPGHVTALGDGVDSMGVAHVFNSGSHWDVQGSLIVGLSSNGDGELHVTDSALITCQGLGVGGGNGADGRVYLSDAGSSIQATNYLQVGGSGATGYMQITDGADASATSSLHIGAGSGSTGALVVTGTGSTLTVPGYSMVGSGGVGTLSLQTGGSVTIGSVFYVGSSSNGTGTVTVTNPGTSLIVDDLRIGYDADTHGTLNISDGASVEAHGFHELGRVADSAGSIWVYGTGSTLDTGCCSPLRIGEAGFGQMIIQAGGTVTNVNGAIGTQPGGIGSVYVGGQGSEWTSSGAAVQVGSASATGFLSVYDGGVVTASGGVNVASGGGAMVLGDGAIQANVTNSGILYPGSFSVTPGTMMITGNYTQTSSGELWARLTDDVAQLEVSGTASLAGTLRIVGPNLLTTPMPGNSFPVITAASRVGTFASVVPPNINDGLLYRVDYSPAAVFVIVDADCNNNGVKDQADIGNQTSQDLDEDGIPDECADPTGDCANNHWFCPQNWPLADVPGEFSADFNVTMGTGDDLCLDNDVEINSLALRAGAHLDLSDAIGGTCDGDLTFASVEGLTVDDSSVAVGPGRVVSHFGGGANMVIRNGGVVTADGSNIDLGSGDLLIESGGRYASSLSVTSPPNTATFTAHNITIRSGFGSSPSEITLSGDMELIANGSFVIDGAGAPCDCGALATANRADVTPPVFNADGRRWRAVDQISIRDAARLNFGSAIAELGGEFVNEATCAECADMSQGTLVLDGPGLRGGANRSGPTAQRFEVAAPDLGSVVNIAAQPYALDTIELAAGSDVTFDDRFDNDGAGQTPCSEALYVKHLVLGAGAGVTARNVRLYYETLTTDPSATITQIGCAAVEAACVPTEPVTPESNPQPKNRYLSFVPGNAAAQTAVRVKLVSLNGFGGFNGQVRWVGPPVLQSEGGGGQFWAAPLQCAPHFRDWSSVNQVHVYGAAIVPSSTYDVQVVHQNCDGVLGNESSYSAPLTLLTGKWGDVVAPYVAGQPNFIDISALVDKFKVLPGAVSKARAQLQPNVPNPASPVNFLDISADVDAFKGVPYMFAGPTGCP